MRDTEIFPLRGEAHHPWHLYIAVLLCTADGKVAVIKDPDSSYVLPRETLNSDDSLVPTIHRMVLDQVGVIPQVVGYLGSLIIPVTRYDGAVIDKTVLYFKAHSESRFAGTAVDNETRKWLTIEEAKELLKQQPNGEEVILERLSVSKS